MSLSDEEKSEFHFQEVIGDIERQYSVLETYMKKAFQEKESFEKRVANYVDFKNHIRKNIDNIMENLSHLMEE